MKNISTEIYTTISRADMDLWNALLNEASWINIVIDACGVLCNEVRAESWNELFDKVGNEVMI